MRVLIVGVGGAGAMAAWRLAGAGHSVTGLEQYTIDHDLGSSYGESRIVRRVYPNTLYTRLMAQSYELWCELMAESSRRDLMVQSGGIFLGPAGDPAIASAEAALSESGVPFERLDARDCMRRFPAFRLDDRECALYEPSMGYARASLAVLSALELARRYGAEIRDRCRVASISSSPSGAAVTLETGERLDADALIITAGPWARPLLQTLGVALPLIVTRQPYVHLQTGPERARYEPPAFPVWIDAAENFYGFPVIADTPGVKIGLHDFGASSSPQTVERTVTGSDRDAIRSYAMRRFSGVSAEVVYEKVCLYTVTPDTDFIIDRVPDFPTALLISACSGHGFKFTPLLGRIAADFVSGSALPSELSAFRLDRFAGT